MLLNLQGRALTGSRLCCPHASRPCSCVPGDSPHGTPVRAPPWEQVSDLRCPLRAAALSPGVSGGGRSHPGADKPSLLACRESLTCGNVRDRTPSCRSQPCTSAVLRGAATDAHEPPTSCTHSAGISVHAGLAVVCARGRDCLWVPPGTAECQQTSPRGMNTHSSWTGAAEATI